MICPRNGSARAWAASRRLPGGLAGGAGDPFPVVRLAGGHHLPLPVRSVPEAEQLAEPGPVTFGHVPAGLPAGGELMWIRPHEVPRPARTAIAEQTGVARKVVYAAATGARLRTPAVE